MREIVSALAANKSEQGNMLISLDIEDDRLFLLHFIVGTYFGPDLRNHHRKLSAFQIQSANLTANCASDDLNGSMMKRAEVERLYHHLISNADWSLKASTKTLRQYFNDADFGLFRDLFPSQLHPDIRVGNRYKFIKSIVFINDPDTSCMREDCVDRFKRLTGLKSFRLSLNIDVTEISGVVAADVVEDEIDKDTCLEVPVICSDNDNVGTCSSDEESDVAAKPAVVEDIPEAQDGPMVGLLDIGECSDAYLFRVSLPGVKRDERDFSCEVEDNGKVVVRGVTTTGEKRVHRFSQVFEMKTQNLSPPGHFSVSFHLPGHVYPQEFSGSFGTDGIFEGIVLKKLKKETV